MHVEERFFFIVIGKVHPCNKQPSLFFNTILNKVNTKSAVCDWLITLALVISLSLFSATIIGQNSVTHALGTLLEKRKLISHSHLLQLATL